LLLVGENMLDTPTKMALAKSSRGAPPLAPWAGLSERVRLRRRGIRWDLDLAEGIDLSIYLLGAFEPRLVGAYRKLIRPGACILDIGANIGAHTLQFAQLVGDRGKVVAYEPTCVRIRQAADKPPPQPDARAARDDDAGDARRKRGPDPGRRRRVQLAARTRARGTGGIRWVPCVTPPEQSR
jgi:hypothetical protein